MRKLKRGESEKYSTAHYEAVIRRNWLWGYSVFWQGAEMGRYATAKNAWFRFENVDKPLCDMYERVCF